ncbi:MAG TPA: hypothetical protein VGD61_18790 [Pyrinomonadaceae bacterium]
MKYILRFALLLSTVVIASGQSAIVEVKHGAPAAAAPRECLAAFRGFFQYLQKTEPGIVRDEKAQKRWLSQELRKALAQKLATFTSPKDDPDYPNNNTFIGSWDQPTSYAIVASRRYGKRAVIDVLYKWGPKTNYPGDERTTSFIFLLEDGAWKLDDIYTFRGEYVQAESLNQYLREKQ